MVSMFQLFFPQIQTHLNWLLNTPLSRNYNKRINQSGTVMSAEKVAHTIVQGIQKKNFTIVPGFEGNLLYAFAPNFRQIFLSLCSKSC